MQKNRLIDTDNDQIFTKYDQSISGDFVFHFEREAFFRYILVYLRIRFSLVFFPPFSSSSLFFCFAQEMCFLLISITFCDRISTLFVTVSFFPINFDNNDGALFSCCVLELFVWLICTV